MGVVLTSNDIESIHVPADDRRLVVLHSRLTLGEIAPGFFDRFWRWLAEGGDWHVIDYLRKVDLSDFDPMRPPPKTDAWRERASSELLAEHVPPLQDILEGLKQPDAVTLHELVAAASKHTVDPEMVRLVEFLKSNQQRVIPHRMRSCGYVKQLNPDASDGLWKVNKRRRAVYTRVALSSQERMNAAAAKSDKTDSKEKNGV